MWNRLIKINVISLNTNWIINAWIRVFPHFVIIQLVGWCMLFCWWKPFLHLALLFVFSFFLPLIKGICYQYKIDRWGLAHSRFTFCSAVSIISTSWPNALGWLVEESCRETAAQHWTVLWFDPTPVSVLLDHRISTEVDYQFLCLWCQQ